MLARRILNLLGFSETPRLQIPETPPNPLHDEAVHQARNQATAPYGMALLSMRRSERHANAMAKIQNADTRPEEMQTERERTMKALGNLMRRVGGQE